MSVYSFQAQLPLKIQDLSIKGVSLAGVGTSLVVPELSLCFDVAQGLSLNTQLAIFLISHGHMDHAGGIPYIISQKALQKDLPPPIFYLPPSLIEPLDKIMKQWSLIENYSYQYQFNPVTVGTEIELKKPYRLQIFPTDHRIPSVGYSLVKKNRKLKKEFVNLNQKEIVELKKKNISIIDEFDEILVSFTGDTRIDFFDLAPEVRKSKVLLMEVTYIDEKKPISEARKWGHIHIDEVIPRLKDLECEQILFIHKSRRYPDSYYNQVLNQKIPPDWRDRIRFLGSALGPF